MWISIFFTVTIIVVSYFTGLYFGSEYQKIIDREKIKVVEQKSKNALENKKRQEIANVKVWQPLPGIPRSDRGTCDWIFRILTMLANTLKLTF